MSTKRFHEIEIGQIFTWKPLIGKPITYTKINKIAAERTGAKKDGTELERFNSQTIVTLVSDITEGDLTLLDAILVRATDTYPTVNCSRLWAALKAAHRAKPIRLNDLLNTCYTDFYKDVIAGAYRHYDPATDSTNGWTAQHAEPKKSWE